MFSKSSKGSGAVIESPSAVKSSPPSIISADLRIVGDLNSDGEIQVDGAIDGDIRTRSLLVGETAHIKGEIVAESVFVHGNVTGQIKSRSVTLAKTAHVVGDILHVDLAIENGAFLEGHCKRMVEKKDAGQGKINVLGRDDSRRDVPKPKEAGTAAQPKGGAGSMAAKDDDKKVATATS